MLELNSKQRKFLEKSAHNLQPIVIVGGAGMTDGVMQMSDKALADHELIKVKFNEYKEEKQELARELCDRIGALLVRLIGNVAILYRPAEKIEERRFEKLLQKI